MSRTGGRLKQAEILEAAIRVFSQKGYHAASMQDLADAVGIKKPSLYHYISSKEELLSLIFERGAGALTKQLAEIAASDLTPSAKLERAITTHLTALCDQLEVFAVYLREQQVHPERAAPFRAAGEEHAALLVRILQEGIRAGEFRPLDPKVVALAIVGMCNWLYQWYSPTGRLSPAEIARLYSALVIEGLAAPRPRRDRHARI